MSIVSKLPAARNDLVEIFYYYISKGTIPTARRFLTQAEATFQRLAGMPALGTRYEPDEPVYAGVRFFPVSRFRVYLVFYRPIAGGIEVLRVLHGARDIHGILAGEFGIEEDAGDDDQEEE
jgi:toxin ParE1/3/4